MHFKKKGRGLIKVEFHPKMIGLTGSHEQIKQVTRAFRVYYSKPPEVAPGEDYLVDHSIFFYLMAPDNSFLEIFAQRDSAETITSRITQHMDQWGK